MWPFRSRRPGKHSLGAAVTAIPVVPPVRAEVVPALPEPLTEVLPEVLPEPAPGPRVELGFRDGSTAALAPGSVQAQALSDIASLLTRRE